MLLKRNERYAVLKYRNKLLISLLIYQGITLAEVTKIKNTDIDFDQATIRIKASRILQRRILNLTPLQIKLLEKYLSLCRPKLLKAESMYLIINKLGNPIKPDDVQYLVETYKYLFPDRKLNLLTIRQSVIANWLNSYHIPIEDVQLLAGHKRPSATLKYKLPDMKPLLISLSQFFL